MGDCPRAPSILELDEAWKSRKGFHLVYQMVALARRWNLVAPKTLQIDPRPLAEPERQRLRGLLEKFLTEAKAAGLAKAFEGAWSKKARATIDAWVVDEPAVASS